MSKSIEAWHFLRKDRRFRYGDKNIAEAGYVYSATLPVELCAWGLHASVKALDALGYAPGPIVGRVVMSGEMIHDPDKLVAQHREYLWITDASDALYDHIRWLARRSLRWWKGAPAVVRHYLESGDQKLLKEAQAITYTATLPPFRNKTEYRTYYAQRIAYLASIIRQPPRFTTDGATYRTSAAHTYFSRIASQPKQRAAHQNLEQRLMSLAP